MPALRRNALQKTALSRELAIFSREFLHKGFQPDVRDAGCGVGRDRGVGGWLGVAVHERKETIYRSQRRKRRSYLAANVAPSLPSFPSVKIHFSPLKQGTRELPREFPVTSFNLLTYSPTLRDADAVLGAAVASESAFHQA
jgi:hypothetical protein